VEYCTLEGKDSLNSTIFIKPTEGDATMTTPRNHQIRRNYFGPRTNIGSNGYETIRIADSSRQSYEMNCVIEENYFYQAISTSSSAEPEVISNKSRGNVYRRNVFDDCDGQLTLRHGRNCVVEENWFKGTGAAYESGVRIIGTGHIVRNNLIQNVNGTRYHAAIAIMDGAYGDTSNQYEGVENTIIEGNVVIDCAAPLHIGIDSGREGYDQPPINTTLTNNRFYHSATDDPLYIIEADATFSSVSGNLAYSAGGEYGDLSRLGNGYSISNNMNLTPPFSDWVTPDQVGHDFSLPHNRPRLRCTQLDATSGEAELSFPALTGEVYTVYVSSDLESWTEVDSNLSVLSDGELSYTLDLATLRTAGTLTQARTNFVRVARMAEASNPPSGSTGGLYLESNGTVVIEAEGFSAQAARSDASAWITSTTLAGASGSYIESPELGANTATWTTGASVSYDISFSTPGTYYLHARFQAATTSGDSFFFGTNGTEIGVDNTGVSTAWVWDNDESEPIVITAPGTYTLTLARREDGIKIDRFLLTTDANASFSGVGPASSPIQE